MLRFSVDELPSVDLGGARIVLGASPGAQLRLPAELARDEHVVISDGRWIALATVDVDAVSRVSGESGPIGAGIVLRLGGMRIAIEPAPTGSIASPPARTESLARELVRGLLGANAAPSLLIEAGPGTGTKRSLPPPIATLVLGRGDEADWVILDEDLSRTHAKIRRGWDGVTVEDLASKNGTKLDGVAISGAAPLAHGATIALGKIVVRFLDPAEAHQKGADRTAAATPSAKRGTPAPAPPAPPPPARRPLAPMLVAASIACVAVAGLVWVLAT